MKQQILEIMHSSPDFALFDIKDGNGNQYIDTGKHVIPGALIGAGVALYMDTVRRKIPEISTKIATVGAFLISGAYEGAEACGDSIPDSSSIVETCKKGFADGNTIGHATMDSTADILVTLGFAATAAFVVSNALFATRRRFHKKPFYKMKESEEIEHLLKWDSIKPADRKIIEIIPDDV